MINVNIRIIFLIIIANARSYGAVRLRQPWLEKRAKPGWKRQREFRSTGEAAWLIFRFFKSNLFCNKCNSFNHPSTAVIGDVSHWPFNNLELKLLSEYEE
jgi:hypothetical protein